MDSNDLDDLVSPCKLFSNFGLNLPNSPIKRKVKQLHQDSFFLPHRFSQPIRDHSKNTSSIKISPCTEAAETVKSEKIEKREEKPNKKSLLSFQMNKNKPEKPIIVNEIKFKGVEKKKGFYAVEINGSVKTDRLVHSVFLRSEKQKKEGDDNKKEEKYRKKEIREFKDLSSRYNKCVAKRKKIKSEFKKSRGSYKEGSYTSNLVLKKKISKVNSFWNKNAAFIPSVFYVLKNEEGLGLFEFNDYSLKGPKNSEGREE